MYVYTIRKCPYGYDVIMTHGHNVLIKTPHVRAQIITYSFRNRAVMTILTDERKQHKFYESEEQRQLTALGVQLSDLFVFVHAVMMRDEAGEDGEDV